MWGKLGIAIPANSGFDGGSGARWRSMACEGRRKGQGPGVSGRGRGEEVRPEGFSTRERAYGPARPWGERERDGELGVGAGGLRPNCGFSSIRQRTKRERHKINKFYIGI